MERIDKLRRFADNCQAINGLMEKLEVAMERFGNAKARIRTERTDDFTDDKEWLQEMNMSHIQIIELRSGISNWVHNHIGDAMSTGMIPTLAELEDRALTEATYRKMMEE